MVPNLKEFIVPSRSQRREQILEAAGNAFLANVYSDVTMQDLAEKHKYLELRCIPTSAASKRRLAAS